MDEAMQTIMQTKSKLFIFNLALFNRKTLDLHCYVRFEIDCEIFDNLSGFITKEIKKNLRKNPILKTFIE